MAGPARWLVFFGLAVDDRRPRPAHEGEARRQSRARGRSVRSSVTTSASSSARTPARCSGCSATRRSCSRIVSLVVIGLIVGLPRAGRAEPVPVDRARPAARRRDRQHDRPASARLCRRLRRHRDRRVPLVHLQRGRRGHQHGARDAVRCRLHPAARQARRARRTREPADARKRANGSKATPGGRSRGDGRRPPCCACPTGSAGRVDRYVADATGLSRSYVQKLISDGRLTADGMRAPGQHDRRDGRRAAARCARRRSRSTSLPTATSRSPSSTRTTTC